MLLFETAVSNLPTGALPTPHLPEQWMRAAYLGSIVLVVVWAALHAWVKVHHRRHGCPPYLVMLIHGWWVGAKTGKFMIGRNRS